MAHIGVLCYYGAGHLNPLIALSRELVSRGHRITFFLPPEQESRIREQGLGFYPIDLSEVERIHHAGSAPQQWPDKMRFRLERLDREIGIYLREYLACISKARVDALLMGEITLAGPTVAEILHTPYFVISTSIPLNFGWNAPRALVPDRTCQEELQARIFHATISCISGPVQRLLDRYRCQADLGPIADIGASFPDLAHITQWPKCLDIARQDLPTRFFYTGPFVTAGARRTIDFPWHKLNGRPLVYASLGTTRKADPEIYSRIAEACAGLDLQLVLTLGGRRDLESLAKLPGDPLVVKNAPQIDLLERADLVITHAGPNTVLETLLAGKPMLALPLALDQPAVAAHLQRLGVAEVLSPQHRSAEEIREAVLRLRMEKRYLQATQLTQRHLQSLNGTAYAASIVERELANHAGSYLPKSALDLTSR